MTIYEILKPCPFCGQEIRDVSIETDCLGASKINVLCNCGADITIKADDVFRTNFDRFRPGLDAVSKWNRRDGKEAGDGEQ